MDVVIDRQELPDGGRLLVGVSVQDGTVVVSLRESTVPPGRGRTPLHITVDIAIDHDHAAAVLACPTEHVLGAMHRRFVGDGRGAVRWAMRLPGCVVQARTVRADDPAAQSSP